jgi:hypothetical protein
MKGGSCFFTSFFLLFPIMVFIFKDSYAKTSLHSVFYNNKHSIYENMLALLLLINIVLSFLFWSDPIEKNAIHFYDGIFAKISYVCFSIYILFIKNIDYKWKLLFLLFLSSATMMFYYSNQCSKENWCCKSHLTCHSIFHLFTSLGSSIAFIPDRETPIQ